MATPIPPNRARFTLEEIVSETRGKLAFCGQEREVVGLVSDSRAAKSGTAFVALRGEKFDGHSFVASALERGARVLVVERGRSPALTGSEASVIEVDDTLVAWGALARAHLAKWRAGAKDPVVIAITGSAGKTTTKELTAALSGALSATFASPGNLNNRIGVPSVIFALEESHRFAVLEMGMSLPGELDAITSFAPPDVAIVTNIGVAHAEGVGGPEGVMREKGAVYRALAKGGVAIVNADDALAQRAAEGTRGRIVTFGRDMTARYRLVSREPDGAGSRLVVAADKRELRVRLSLPGEVAALDFVAALAAVEAASPERLAAPAIEQALSKVALQGRSVVRRLGGDTLVFDDTYNANPASMRAAIATLSEIAGGRRRVAVLGEMKELGSYASVEHAALGDVIADAGLALVIGCGGLIDLALERAGQRGVQVIRCADTAEAARVVTAQIRPGDAILVKGSRSVGAEKVVATLLSELPTTLPFPSESASSGKA